MRVEIRGPPVHDTESYGQSNYSARYALVNTDFDAAICLLEIHVNHRCIDVVFGLLAPLFGTPSLLILDLSTPTTPSNPISKLTCSVLQSFLAPNNTIMRF